MKLRSTTFTLVLACVLVVSTQNVEGKGTVECQTDWGSWSKCVDGMRSRSQKCLDKPKGCNSCSTGSEREKCRPYLPS